MKKVKDILMVGLMALLLASCTEDIVIDVEDGDRMIGVAATFTDEMKCHEAILSYTDDFYNNNEDIRMVTGATVYVTDNVDTVYYIEDTAQPGHYFTAPVAGKKNTLYRLCITAPDINGNMVDLFAESYVPDNVDCIDSLVLKPYNGLNDSVPTVFFGDTVEFLYPYFQSLMDSTIVYMPMISKNDTLLTDSLGDMRMVIPMAGYAGYYVNGPEMQMANKEIPIYYFRKSQLRIGDAVRVDLFSIGADYIYFYYSLMMSTGSNPMLGAPANVSTNIQPEGLAVGWFMTASVVSAETIFDDRY
jgi:hypothetical protein